MTDPQGAGAELFGQDGELDVVAGVGQAQLLGRT